MPLDFDILAFVREHRVGKRLITSAEIAKADRQGMRRAGNSRIIPYDASIDGRNPIHIPNTLHPPVQYSHGVGVVSLSFKYEIADCGDGSGSVTFSRDPPISYEDQRPSDNNL